MFQYHHSNESICAEGGGTVLQCSQYFWNLVKFNNSGKKCVVYRVTPIDGMQLLRKSFVCAVTLSS